MTKIRRAKLRCARIRRACYLTLSLLHLHLGMLGAAQVGWAVSERVRVPQTDFSVTGPPPYDCLEPREVERLKRDPVYRFHVWAADWLETNWDWVGRLQTHDNCAEVCAAVPLEAQAIVELRGFVRELPTQTLFQGVWPSGGSYSRWEQDVDSSLVENGKRQICATLHTHGTEIEGYFVVYFSY